MTKRNKSQKIIEGAILQINISENRIAFARIVPSNIAIYNFLIKQKDPLPDFGNIINKEIFYYCSVYDSIIKQGLFPVIGIIPLTQEDIDKVPPKFHQDIGSGNCVIFWNDGTEREALPEECIGLESASVWTYEGLIEFIEDHFSGRKNFTIETSKVILSEKDPRWWAMREGKRVKWNFERRELYISEE